VRVLAENAPEEAINLVIVLDAKRGQIFTARFARVDGGWVEQEGAHVDTLAGMVGRSPRPVHLLGEGLPFHEQFLDRADAGVIVTAAESWRARAAAVAQLGWKLARGGEFTEPPKLLPIYIRVPEAEEKLARAEG
jgi:tRNA A37 threonylcarbamoyladenosine modification protein TsaB